MAVTSSRTIARVMLLSLALMAAARPARAERITVLCSNGLRAVIQDLAPRFERETGHEVVLIFSVAAELRKRIDSGEAFDLAILTPMLVDQLIAQGKVVSASRVAIARSGMAIAVRAGAPKPALQSVDALTATLLAAPSIAFAREGAGGVFFAALVQRLGLTDRLTPQFRPLTTGQDVSQAVAQGDAALGVLPLSEILSVPGIDVGGVFPPAVQDYVVMVGGVSSTARHGAPAESLLRFLMSADADATVQRRGMQRPSTR